MLVQLRIVSEMQGNLGVYRECKIGLFQELPSKHEKFSSCVCVMGCEKS